MITVASPGSVAGDVEYYDFRYLVLGYFELCAKGVLQLLYVELGLWR